MTTLVLLVPLERFLVVAAVVVAAAAAAAAVVLLPLLPFCCNTRRPISLANITIIVGGCCC